MTLENSVCYCPSILKAQKEMKTKRSFLTKKRPLRGEILALALVCCLTAAGIHATSGTGNRTRDLPRVLIIGDSISQGYTPYVRKLLEKTSAVFHNPGNAEHTGTGLRLLEEWLGSGDWDVIHFNWGLWDLCYRHPESIVQGNRDKVRGTLTTPLDQYEINLKILVDKLKKTRAKLIWASTTPVPEGEAGRFRGDEIRYNAVAARIMRDNGIPINDLYSHAVIRLKDIQLPDGNVHFTPAGYIYLAEKVAQFITKIYAQEPPDIPPLEVVPTATQVQYQKMEYIGFIHFTVNTFSNKEWGYGDESPEIFNPTAFDADQWAKVARESGMKQLILTVKHHDGFCLWPSRYTEHSVKNSPWKNGKGNIVREFVDACRRQGIRVGFYLSPWDRNHAGYGTESYLQYYRNQLTELLTEYGEISEIWFDGANGGDGYYGGARETRRIDRTTYYHWQDTWAMIKALQPQVLLFSDAGPDIRWIGNERGYAGATNWSTLNTEDIIVGAADTEYLNTGDPQGKNWVIPLCNTSIRPGWFYHPEEDDQAKSLQQLLDVYYMSVGRNGTLLLNVPPDRRGLFHENDVERLQEFKAILDETFQKDLAFRKSVIASNVRQNHSKFSPKNTTDGVPDSYWAGKAGTRQARLEIDLQEPAVFDRILLQEPIRFGQRIAEFEVTGRVRGEWTHLAYGTTIGYKRILRIPQVEVDRIRIIIQDGINTPALSNIGLYKASPREKPIQALSPFGKEFYPQDPNETTLQKYLEAKADFEKNPDDPDALIWYGRRTAYLGKYRQAIDIYSQGIEKFPDDARFLRHRGHRYISIREFDKAVQDLEAAAAIIEGTEDTIEPDGMPNAMNIPVSSLHSNIWYHLGLAYYLKNDLRNALRAHQEGIKVSFNGDQLVSATHWLYMILCRLGREEEAKKVLDPIQKNLQVIENTAYHRLCLFYKGELTLDDLTDSKFSSMENDAVAYGVGNWHLCNGDREQAKAIFQKILQKEAWASFGYIAAESDLAREFK